MISGLDLFENETDAKKYNQIQGSIISFGNCNG
jgi:hypothetical protein